MRKPMPQISCAVNAQLISAFVFATTPLLPKSEISNLQPSPVGVQPAVVLDLVGNPEDRFSRLAAQIIVEEMP